MALGPTDLERLARARADLRIGLPVCLTDGTAHALVLAAEGLQPARLAALRDRAATQPVIAVTAWRAATLKARAYDGDIARISLPPDATPAFIRSVADPADDLSSPMKGPFRTLRDGDAALHRAALRLIKSAHLLPAALVAGIAAPPPLAETITTLNAADAAHALDAQPVVRAVVSGRVPLSVAEAARVHVFRPADGGEEHYAAEIGHPPRDAPVLARLHSACFTGDILGSLKCDCGPQLHSALAAMGKHGSGVLLYLNQEGRGIGLANKMRAYSLQDQGFDTVEANHRLGFEDDERDFRIGAAILAAMGFSSVRLMTNNPAKVEMMRHQGIEVAERVPLKAGLNPLNAGYLDTKAKKSGHIL